MVAGGAAAAISSLPLGAGTAAKQEAEHTARLEAHAAQLDSFRKKLRHKLASYGTDDETMTLVMRSFGDACVAVTESGDERARAAQALSPSLAAL